VINVSHGEPIVFGTNGEYCVVKSGFSLEVAKTADVAVEEIVVHGRARPTTPLTRSRCPGYRIKPRPHRPRNLPPHQPAHLR